ncbi:MAG: hypothetical protein ABI585_10570 [Betaproteobacteria bacterium]
MSAERAPALADAALLDRLGVVEPMPLREAALYVRYLRALALLCECVPYLDEPDYAERIDEVLDDLEAHYPFDVGRDGDRRSLTPRTARGE